MPAVVRDFDAKRKWYGSDGLWVAEPGLLDPADGGGADKDAYRTKYASITLDGQGRATDERGAPRVEAERLGGGGSDSVRGSTGGFATGDGGRQWWPTIIQFPGPGCWRVTETLGATEVRFTVHVPEA
ncbi:hypothetical protein [Streptomyces triticagri]|uniref:hypothetical protein n=1 Tax=Streptomyces triticagri TaxID=2293568 RepID=UPI0013143A9B|nr:hypothetical protein [Streptomyces triticagri]